MDRLERKKPKREQEIHELERRISDLRSYREELVQELRGVQQGEAAVEHKAAMAVMEERERRATDKWKEAQARRSKVEAEVRNLEKESALVRRVWADEHQDHELRKSLNIHGSGEAVGAIMAAAIAGTGCFQDRDMEQGVTMWTYRNAKPSEFEMAAGGRFAMRPRGKLPPG